MLEPENYEALWVLGQAFAGQRDNERAHQAFERAANISPELPGSWHNLGHFYLETGRYDDAVRHLEKALQLRHDLPDALYSLGLAYAKLGNTAAALAQCETLSVLDSDKARELRDEIGA